MSTAIVWLRRDLRLADHPALHHALSQHLRVVLIYIHAPDELVPWADGAASHWWLHHSLAALQASVAAKGGQLLLREGASIAVLQALIAETAATAVYWSRCYEPAAIARDQAVKTALRAQGITAESFNASLLFEPWQLKTKAVEPYRVFSPLWRNAEPQLGNLPAPLPAPDALPPLPAPPPSLPLERLGLLPKLPWAAAFPQRWTPGEAGALARLAEFADGTIVHYKQQQYLPALPATSGLSPHLHFGEISPRQALAVARLATAGASASAQTNAGHFVRELGWREFSHHLLFHYPHTADKPMYEKFAAFPWRSAADYAHDLKAWQQGRTGVPIVDAGMRELWTTGWMHNRVRMIVASYLTKNLLIPWQAGAAWFWDTLVDADLAQNSLGWQWSAGCGADAAPYFRIFNPTLQGEKFDPDGAYTRHWVPELAKLGDQYLHRPWEAPSDARRAAGIALDSPYAKPIVDLMQSRDRALAAYERIKAAQ